MSKQEDGSGKIHSVNRKPTKAGWYECWAVDDRWGGQMQYRAWGNGLWWTPLADGRLSAPAEIYKWRGPVADINGPAPDGTNPTKPEERNMEADRHEDDTDNWW